MRDRERERSWDTIQEGDAVFSSDGKLVGTVRAVRGDRDNDLFTGIVVSGRGTKRFVGASHVCAIRHGEVEVALGGAGSEPRTAPRAG